MNNKNTGLIATIAAVVLCGCPGLFMCLFGALTAAGRGTANGQSLGPGVGIALICLSFIFVLIPIAVGFFTLRKKPEASTDNTPLPPAS